MEATEKIIGLVPPVLAVGLTLSLFDILNGFTEKKKEKEKKLKKEVI